MTNRFWLFVWCIVATAAPHVARGQSPVSSSFEPYAIVMEMKSASGEKTEAKLFYRVGGDWVEICKADLPFALPAMAEIRKAKEVSVSISLPKGRYDKEHTQWDGTSPVVVAKLNEELPLLKNPGHEALAHYLVGGVTRAGEGELDYPVEFSAARADAFVVILKSDWPKGSAMVAVSDSEGNEIANEALARAANERVLVSPVLRKALAGKQGQSLSVRVQTGVKSASCEFMVLSPVLAQRLTGALKEADAETDVVLRHLMRAHAYEDASLLLESMAELKAAHIAGGKMYPRLGAVVQAFAAQHGLSGTLP